ncbi:MAG: D-sedoheptulose 7-phosphate isomerase [Candidatus Sumerlaeia bacterium]
MDTNRLISLLHEREAAGADVRRRLTTQHADTIAAAARLIAGALGAGRKILACGNGGSAADAQHFAAELVGRFVADRRPLPAVALTANTSNLTSIANDFGFEDVFRRQVAALGEPGDVLVAISTSGRSPNVLRAAEEARARGLKVVGLTGRDGGALRHLCDVCVVVPDAVTAHIQEAHIFLIHYFCAVVDESLE